MNYATLPRLWQAAALLTGWLLAATVYAAGLLTPVNGGLPALELRDHHVSVVIEDGYAITSVEQVFHNPHARDLEASYSFPVPEHGSVAEFTLWIDGQPVTGEVLENRAARRIYAEEKAAGRDAGVAGKDAYRSFDGHVAPVRAGGNTRTRLVYLQPAHVDTGIGRYAYPLEEGGVDEQNLAFWTANETVTGSFSFDLRIKSAYPVEAVRLPGQPGATMQHTPLVNGARISATRIRQPARPMKVSYPNIRKLHYRRAGPPGRDPAMLRFNWTRILSSTGATRPACPAVSS